MKEIMGLSDDIAPRDSLFNSIQKDILPMFSEKSMKSQENV
jgi:hypothetical protein